MLQQGPVIIIHEGDSYNALARAVASFDHTNDVIIISRGTQVIECLRELAIAPALVLSHLTVPQRSAFRQREELLAIPGLLSKDVPYVFYSETAQKDIVREAYSHQAAGFFLLPDTADGLGKLLSTVINYWCNALHP